MEAQRGILWPPQRGILWSPRGVYLECQIGLWVPKRVYLGFQEVYIFCLRRVRLENTSIHLVYNIFCLSKVKFYQMGLPDYLVLSKAGIHQCGGWYKDHPRFDNCQLVELPLHYKLYRLPLLNSPFENAVGQSSAKTRVETAYQSSVAISFTDCKIPIIQRFIHNASEKECHEEAGRFQHESGQDQNG